jgi:hypothetical protein
MKNKFGIISARNITPAVTISITGFNVTAKHILTTENIYVLCDSHKKQRLFPADDQFIILCNGELMVTLP